MLCVKGTAGRAHRMFASAVLVVALGALVWMSAYAASLTVPKVLWKYRHMCGSVGLEKDAPAEGDLPTTAPKQIWFIESSGLNGTCLNERQACAVESAAVHNPYLQVNLILTGSQSLSCHTLTLLNSSLPNFHIAFVDVEVEFKGSPLDPWYKSGIWKMAKNKMEDLSDALRWLVLWKRGGIYLDLDVVVLQCLDEYDNMAGFEDSVYPGPAALAFQKGHPFLTTVQEYRE
ncbi:lactosylceramide 4-alpha-galactosyltransferase-like [Amblyomma americanum]